ncbi:hypothetical protein D3C78_1351000 [compost metagenome]
MGIGVIILEQGVARRSSTAQTGGVVQQHARSNALIPFVLHLEIGYILNDGSIQINFPFVYQFHDGRSPNYFADRANTV